ncbi:MAG: hypothetical protein O2931_06385 [Planctomycetota bacterium]|nr:hypothetical protein [Planctomycetota bacterium]MDA1178409.1 hypothetical protein [Planctomycetota bacterium]
MEDKGPPAKEFRNCVTLGHSPRLAAIALLALLLFAVRLVACQIPVFRYALERWEPDAYSVQVLYESPLTAEQESLISRLKRTGSPGDPMNLTVEVVDLSGKSETERTSLVPKGTSLPAVILQYPQRQRSAELAWFGALTEQHVQALLESPARQELAKRLLDGHSAVWLLVESGDPQQDASAYERLEQGIASAQTRLSLPQIDVLEKDESFRADTKVALRLEFSMIRIRHDDPAEAILRSVLRHSEPDLSKITGPLAIPVYGRGRTHFALAGEGIHQQNIETSCQFVVGACSCQVKAQNPGIDLPMAVPWSSEISDAAITTVSLPELSGLGELAAKAESVSGQSVSEQTEDSLAEESLVAPPALPGITSSDGQGSDLGSANRGLLQAIIVATVAMAAAVAVASLWIRRGRDQ